MLKLDLKDRKLLYWLDQNSRSTNKALAKNVGLTEQAIGYRIKRLQEKGVLKNVVTFVNTLSLGYQHYKVFIRLHETTEEIEREIMNDLVGNPVIRWVVSLIGEYDLSFSVLAKTPRDFTKIYDAIEAKFGRYIIEKNIVINVRSPGFTRDWLIDGKESRMLEYGTSEKVQEIDDVDAKIIKTISQNARKNVVAIAREINSTVDVVKYRLKKLKEKNIISGFTLQLDLAELGYEYYSVLFYTHNLSEETENRILTFARLHPAVRFTVRTIGNHDLQLELEVKNHAELDGVLKAFRQQFAAHIRDFEILRVTKEYKYDFFPFQQ